MNFDLVSYVMGVVVMLVGIYVKAFIGEYRKTKKNYSSCFKK